MKIKLLLSGLCLTLFSISLNAQRTWDMGTNTTLWPLNSPSFSTGSVVVDGLTEYSGNTFGQTGASVLTWADDFNTETASNVYSNGNQVYVSNVKSKTAVSVYSIGGALIKTLETSEDTAFALETGIWIVKIKSA